MIGYPFLWPAPQNIKLLQGQFDIADQVVIHLVHTNPDAIFFFIQKLQDSVKKYHQKTWHAQIDHGSVQITPGISIQIIPEIFRKTQSYRLLILPEHISLTAADPAGAFYGINTLIQILQQNKVGLPCLEIFDYPDFISRGVMLDISRDRVPTMETLFRLVDLFASWKLNQLQLYTEHTFAYRPHYPVWQNASPMTPEEILILDKYCHERFIELVPNQNSFGHMHRWLKHPNYANLAEVHGWFESPWGPMEGPFSLCPLLPESLDFLNGLYDELLPNFRSRLCNVGCDETVDLGKGKSKAVCEQQGTGPVYLEFLLKIWRTIHKRNHIMQFWGDIILEHPELIPQLPDNVIALEWGYEATHPFANHASQFAQSGVPFYVCPGTSAWNSIVGRIDNALENLKIAAKSGLENGALGYLITDWGDNGHWQQLPISFPGYLAGAGYSWSYQSNKNGDIRKALDHFCLYDLSCNFGELMWTIGNLYQDAGVVTHNASILFQVMQLPLSSIKNDPNLQQYQIGKVLDHLQISRQLLARCDFSEKDSSIVQDELELSIRMVQHACQRINFAKGEGDSQALLSEIDGLISDYQRLWLHRSRPGGLEDSLARLVRCRADYI